MTSPRGASDIESRDRLPTLTGLRFWAALLVVLYHLTHQMGEIVGLSHLTRYGRSGVTFFFVLSGFVLAWNYLDRPTRFTVFVWRRFARLWPLVVVTGVLSLMAYAAVGVQVGWVKASTTFTFLQAWRLEWASGANPASWSLSDEAFFYLVFPLVLAVAAVPRLRGALWVLTGVGLVGGWLLFASSDLAGWWLDYFPPSRVLQFVLGVLCAVAMKRGLRAPLAYWPAVALVVVYHLALVPWGNAVTETGMGGYGAFSGSQWWAAPVFALLIMAAAQADLDGRRTGASGPWSLRLGHWSYAWYLVHEIVFRLWNHYVSAPLLVSWLVPLTASLAVAGALYTYVEHPAERTLRARGPQPAPARAVDAEPAETSLR